MKKFSNLRLLLAGSAFITTAFAIQSFAIGISDVATTYYYVSSDMTEGAFRQTGHWNTVNENGDCGSIEPYRPCSVIVPSGSSLAAVLASKTNSEVLGISSGYKDLP